MNTWKHTVLLLLAIVVFCSSMNAQPSAVVPRLINFSGIARDEQGKPIAGTIGATFSIYRGESGGAPLWLESQNVQADAKGKFTAQLGSTKPEGLPLDLFTSGEARWLGVWINGGEEQPRVLLLSVPYALKAADAETLGGKPASAFMAAPGSGNGTRQEGPQVEQKNEIVCSSGAACTTGFVPLFSTNGGSAKVGNSLLSQSGSTVTVSGSHQITGNESVLGNISGSGAITAGFVGSLNGSGAAIVGTSHGTSGGSDGVDGVTTSGTASGVAGINQSGGIGVYGTGGTGVFGTGSAFGFMTDSNVQQARTAGGWVKAMVYVNARTPPYGIQRCFNSTLAGPAATTPPCGINFTEVMLGDWQFDFGFEVDDRILSATLTSGSFFDFGSASCIAAGGSTNSLVEVVTWDCSANGSGKPAYFNLLVF